MPFTSKKQMRYMYATHPKIAKKMTKRMEKKQGKGAFKKLPESHKSKDECESIESMESIT
jgi:hypothetical protein